MFLAAFRSLQLTSRHTGVTLAGLIKSTTSFAPRSASCLILSRTYSDYSTQHSWRVPETPQVRMSPETLAKLLPTEHTSQEQWDSWEKTVVKGLHPPPTPYSGRSVPVTRDELPVAFARLKRILDRNNIQRELRMGERHEKKGYKRRRLESERWRRRFAHEVRKKVQIVNEIRARGA